MKEQSAAILTIKDASKMTKHGRKAIAAWLRRHATFLVKHGDEFAPRFVGRYMYRKA